MKNLLAIYTYIHKFYGDSLESLRVFLCFYLLYCKNQALFLSLLNKKEKEMAKDFYLFLESFDIKLESLQKEMNWKKILRMFLKDKANLESLQEFLQCITLQKTILKLYDYATPLEINELVCGILNPQENESLYNPCCGMGSWILSLGKNLKFSLLGEDINAHLVEIARIFAQIVGLKKSEFLLNDAFSKDSKCTQKFSKIFCNPPILSHILLPSFKNLSSDFESFSKIAPEISFFIHSLSYMEKRAVFLIRNTLLDKPVGRDFREYLCKNKYLEMVIDLPHNLVPRQSEEFSLLVLSKENKKVYFFDAQKFFIKSGKYNKIVNIDEILDCTLFKQERENAKLVDYKELNLESLRACFYTNNIKDSKNSVCLENFLQTCFRGQRLTSQKDEKLIECYEVGIKEFNNYCFLENFGECSFKPDDKRVQALRLRPFDILLSMRGMLPKVTIVGENIGNKCVVVNAGILILRPKNKEIAKALYLYLIAQSGMENLANLYKENYERIGEKQILKMRIPQDFLEKYNYFEKLCALSLELKTIQNKIHHLLKS